MEYQSIVMNPQLSIGEKKKHVREFVTNQAKDFIFDEYEDIVFISKSIGTIEAGWLAEQLSVKVTQIFLTPVSETIPYFTLDNKIVIGTKDKAYEIVKTTCDEKQIAAVYIEDANHSLEIEGKPYESIDVLKRVLEFIEA